MAFNWKDFATGFLEKTTETIEDKAAEAKQRQERQEALARQNASLIQQRRQRARTAATLGQQAMALGATEEQIAVALNSGVAGIQTFYQNLQAAANQRGVRSLGPDDIDAIIDMPSIPPVDMSYEDMVQQVYGARPTTVPEPQSEPPLWASMMGLTADRDMQQRLATEPFADGLTVQQINDMAAGSDFSQIPGMEGAYVNYGEDTFFTNEAAMDFRQSMRDARLEVERSKTFTNMRASLTADVKSGLKTGEEAAEELQNYVAEQIKLDLALKGMATTYSTSFLTNPIMQDWFESEVPEDMMASLLKGFGQPEAPEAADETSRTDSDPEEVAEQTVTDSTSPSEVTVTELPRVRRVEPRPPSSRPYQNKRQAWVKQYGDRFDPETGEAILVEPRPPEGTTEEKPGRGHIKARTIDLYEKWNRDYGDTHNPDGTPKEMDDDEYVGGSD